MLNNVVQSCPVDTGALVGLVFQTKGQDPQVKIWNTAETLQIRGVFVKFSISSPPAQT